MKVTIKDTPTKSKSVRYVGSGIVFNSFGDKYITTNMYSKINSKSRFCVNLHSGEIGDFGEEFIISKAYKINELILNEVKL